MLAAHALFRERPEMLPTGGKSAGEGAEAWTWREDTGEGHFDLILRCRTRLSYCSNLQARIRQQIKGFAEAKSRLL